MKPEMTPERWRAVDAMVQAALDRAPAERPAFLARACGADAALRAEVESLLAAGDGAEGFLSDAIGVGAVETTTRVDERDDARIRVRLASSLREQYAVERELGRGGMATVYLAEDLKHRRKVAIKVMHPEFGVALGAERFLREIEVTAGLQHPHILALHDSGSAEGLLYYVMPYVEGASLRERLASDGALPVTEALRILRDVADALDYAHGQGILHRDIKPENILLSRGHALVADFGVARALGRARDARGRMLTQTGFSVGTPAYMSPEQLAGGREMDGRSDVYSLACVAYEMLAGAPPFAGPAAEQAAWRGGAAPLSLTARLPDLPDAAEDVLRRALALSPADRFATASEFAEQLAQALVTGLRPHRARRLLPRAAHRRVALIIAVVAAVVGALLWRPGSDRRATPVANPPYSLAVLPLKNYSGDPAQEYFANGMTEELTITLSKLEALRVIAHQSVLQFKHSDRSIPEIARLLNVRHVVDGSVMQDGRRIRITATLVDATRNTPVWSERFERERHDVMALQRDVALAIARAIEIALTPKDLARLAHVADVDPDAFAHYLKGTQARYVASATNDFTEAERHFARAIAKDSGYAPAYAGLALVHALDGREAQARQFAATALELDPSLADAHLALGMVREIFDWDWAGAESEFRQAIQLNAGHAEAHHELSMLLMRRRRFDEALREARGALYLAPMSARFESAAGHVLLYSGRYDEALDAANRATALDPTYLGPYYLRGHAYTHKGTHEQALKSWNECMAAGCDARPELGYVYAVSGRRTEALKLLDTLKAGWEDGGHTDAAAIGIATILIGLGERSQALDWLERGVASGTFILYLPINPYFRSLRSEPRFQAMLKKVGLDE